MHRLKIWCGALAAALLVSGCTAPETRAGRDLAESVKIEGYRWLAEQHKAETTLLYFAGPPGVDLKDAASARNWSPQAPDADAPETGAYKRVAEGSANTEEHACRVVVSTLRPGFESVAIELSEAGKREVAEGKLVYVEVACFCAGPPA